MAKTMPPIVMREKVSVGISACQFGAKVRWNEKGYAPLENLGRDKHGFVWTPVCPEVAAGLGVPRPPIRLVSGSGEAVWAGQAKVKNRQGKDVSDALKTGATLAETQCHAATIDAFVFMEGSPSCGVYRTTLKNQRLGKPPGVFGARLLANDWFLIPAADLASPLKWWDWRRRLHAFVWLRHQEPQSLSDVFDLWYRFKFLAQEIHNAGARQIGRELANWPKRPSQAQIKAWKGELLALLRRPVTYGCIYSMLQKHLALDRKSVV